MNFKVEFRDVINNLLPHFLRLNTIKSFLFSLIKPLSTLNDNSILVTNFNQSNTSLYQFTLFIKKFLRFNSQTIYLEKYLNNEWDSTLARIYIINTASEYPAYVYNIIEGKYKIYLYNTSEVKSYHFYNVGEEADLYDFVVYLPNSIKISCGYPNYTKMKSQINQYKISGKRFTILEY